MLAEEELVGSHQILQQLVLLVELAAAVMVVIIQMVMEPQEAAIPAVAVAVVLVLPVVMMVMEPQEALDSLLSKN